MTLSYIGNGVYTGLSTDTKPVTAAIGWRFYEIDTRKIYLWNGSSWGVGTPGLDIANTFTATQAINKTAEAGVAETVAEFSVSDVASHIRFYNGSATNSRFMPCIRGRQQEDAGLSGIFLEGRIEAAHDTGSIPVTVIQSTRQDAAQITTRPLLALRNAGTPVFNVNAKGDILQTTTAQAGVEGLHQWKLSDDASSNLQILNATATDGVFVPMFRGSNHTANTANPGLYVVGRILHGQDSGGTPAMIFDSRTTGDAALTTRPLFRFRNAASTVFEIKADKTVVSEGIILKTNVWETKPTASTYPGSLLYEEDTNSLYRSDGTAWSPILTKMETIKRTGALNGGCLTVNALAVGVLAEGTLYGKTPVKGFSGNGGTTTFFSGALDSDGPTGYRVLNVSRVDRHPKLRCKSAFNNPDRTRFHCGLTTKTAQIATGTTVPISDTEGGIFFGFDETSNWMLWTNDGTGPVTVTDTNVAVTISSNNPDIVTLRYDHTNSILYWTIQTFTGAYKGNGNISAAGGAKLPQVAQALHFHWNFEITEDTATNVALYSLDYEGDK